MKFTIKTDKEIPAGRGPGTKGKSKYPFADMKPKQYFVVKSWAAGNNARHWSRMVGNKWKWGVRVVDKELRLYRIS